MVVGGTTKVMKKSLYRSEAKNRKDSYDSGKEEL